MLALITASTTLVEENALSDDNALAKSLDVLTEHYNGYKDDVTLDHVQKAVTIVKTIGDEVNANYEELKVSTNDTNEFLFEVALSFISLFLFKFKADVTVDIKLVRGCVSMAHFGQHINADGISERAVYLLKLIVQIAKSTDQLDSILPENTPLESDVLRLISS